VILASKSRTSYTLKLTSKMTPSQGPQCSSLFAVLGLFYFLHIMPQLKVFPKIKVCASSSYYFAKFDVLVLLSPEISFEEKKQSPTQTDTQLISPSIKLSAPL